MAHDKFHSGFKWMTENILYCDDNDMMMMNNDDDNDDDFDENDNDDNDDHVMMMMMAMMMMIDDFYDIDDDDDDEDYDNHDNKKRCYRDNDNGTSSVLHDLSIKIFLQRIFFLIYKEWFNTFSSKMKTRGQLTSLIK